MEPIQSRNNQAVGTQNTALQNAFLGAITGVCVGVAAEYVNTNFKASTSGRYVRHGIPFFASVVFGAIIGLLSGKSDKA